MDAHVWTRARFQTPPVRSPSCMSSTTKLAQQLHRTAARWSVDPFRPHLQLGNFLKSLADHPQLTPAAVRAARALEEGEFQKKVCETRSSTAYTLPHLSHSTHSRRRCSDLRPCPNITPGSSRASTRARRASAAHGGRSSLVYGSPVCAGRMVPTHGSLLLSPPRQVLVLYQYSLRSAPWNLDTISTALTSVHWTVGPEPTYTVYTSWIQAERRPAELRSAIQRLEQVPPPNRVP